jgi:uncharacterized membrane protein YozB (DUF420 family)/cytochrome oxidase Cu insertion factor (SCO1/SenC/PrrC family)
VTAPLLVPLSLAVAVLAFVAPPVGKAKPRPAEAPAVAERDHIADFALVDQRKRKVTRDDLLGKVWIASFILIPCPDGKCQQVTQTVERLQEELPDHPDLRLVTFIVKDHEDPRVLDRYLRDHHVNPRRWLFLSGNEEEIDRVMRSCYLRGPKTEVGSPEHAQKLVLVDQAGKIRGWYDGLNDRNAPEGDFEQNLRKLRREVKALLAPKQSDFPAFNAALNAASAVLVLLGWGAIRRRLIRLHIACMLSAMFVSAVFLASYLYYHLVVKSGVVTRFRDQAPDAPSWVGHVYGAILFTHTILAVVVTPLVLWSAYLGLRNRLSQHMRMARLTLPVWLYVSVTGVVVYWMLYRLYPAG